MKKIKKNKNVLKVTLGLAAVALGTVGFSSWVINGITPDTTGNVSVSASDVVDKRVTLTVDQLVDGAVVFGPIENAAGGLITSSNGKEEDLDFEFKFSVAVANEATNINGFLKNVKVTYTVDESARANYNYLIENKYITCPIANEGTNLFASDTPSLTEGPALSKGFKLGSSSIAVSPTNTAKIHVIASFGWGEAFHFVNPITYYNESTNVTHPVYGSNTKDGTNAASVLNELKTRTKGLKFTVTLTPIV